MTAPAPSPSQSCKASLAEATTIVVLGYGLAVLAQRAVYPLFGIATTLGQDGLVALVFTSASLARSFAVRRLS